MKRLFNHGQTLCLLVASLPLISPAQTAGPSQRLLEDTNVAAWKTPSRVSRLRGRANVAEPVVTNVASPAASDWVPRDAGPHSRTWVTTANASTAGSTIQSADAKPAQRFVELASGMNFWTGTRWRPSVGEFQPTDEGFVAAQIQHAVRLSADIN